ncbi:MAG TPA: ABC transporter ATP-binding protein [Casimicrobiaceae bacterium]|nr:ABC transporter ATP-binding protein [Casimicrobiaceae bacterium]
MIRLDNVTKAFETPSGTALAADRVSFEVAEGEICVLLGPSGCGKTTTLKMVNRLIELTSGKIFINGKDHGAYDPVELRRTIGYVIQQIGLFPNMTVEENICVVPKLLGWDMEKARKRAAELLAVINLEPAIFLKRYPKELSGGQQQRVGVARALAADPPVLLMDEPFGAIDPINREVIQDEFLKIHRRLKKTVMFVSHDIDEAVKMADKIAIFRAGKLEQFDSPDNILAHPINGFIADFVGHDRTLKRLRLVKVLDATDKAAPKVLAEERLDRAAAMMNDAHSEFVVVLDAMGRPHAYVARDVCKGQEGNVAEFGTRLPATVKLDEDLRTAVSMMFMYDVPWLTCVDENGLYAGIVTQRGITRLLGDTYRDDVSRKLA